MNFELFIAKRIHFGGDHKKKVSSPAIKIAVAGIALGIAMMILSVCIIVGFKNEIRDKIIGFNSHIQITSFDYGSNDVKPVNVSDALIANLKSRSEIKHIEVYASKLGIIKTDTDFQGILMKGVGNDYDWSFIQKNLVEGEILDTSDSGSANQIIISKIIADRLHLKLGDSFISYFVQEPIKLRKFVIKGIYSTNFDDYDKLFVITKLSLIQKLNGWEENQVTGIELFINDFEQLDEVRADLYFDMASYKDDGNEGLSTRSAKEMNPTMFNWLQLLDMNVWVIIILMLLVSGVTMASGLLIIILERINMIGILKAMGAKNISIRKIFIYISTFLILKGMFWGNLIALTLCILQKQFGIIKLDPANYYISEAPIELNVLYIVLINVGAFVASVLMMVGPSYLISKISPSKSIRFE